MTGPWLVVGESLDKDSDGEPLRLLGSEPYRLLAKCLQAAGADPRALIYTGVPTRAKVSDLRGAYQDGFEERLVRIRPSKILALGGIAATVAKRSTRMIPITKERGLAEWRDYDGGRALLVCTVNPTMALRHQSAFSSGPAVGNSKSFMRGDVGSREWVRDILRDTEKWVRQGAPLPAPRARWTAPAGRGELRSALAALAPHEEVSVDLETEPQGEALADLLANGAKGWRTRWPDAGLRPLEDRTMSIGVGALGAAGVIVRRPLLDDPRVKDLLWPFLWEGGRLNVFHNAKFDLQFLARWFGSHAPAGARIADTMLLSFLLDERPVRSEFRAHGLKDISRYRYDVPDYAFDWPAFWHAPDAERDWESLDRYHAMDLHQTARLHRDLTGEIAAHEPRLQRVHDRMLVPATLAMAEAEFRGIPVDREYLEAYQRRLDRRMDLRLRGLRARLGDPGFNPASSAQAEEVAFDQFGMEPITYSGFKVRIESPRRNSRKEQLAGLAGQLRDMDRLRDAQVLEAITAWRHDQKARDTYAAGLLRASTMDGRVRASFNLAGAATGRLSSSNPNMQNIPKRGPSATLIRRAFRASPGHLLMEGDYSQLELRVAALLSMDERLAAVYREGRDIHREVASVMFHKPPEDLDYMERYLAKAVDFGALYGRSGKAISYGAEMEYYEKVMGGTRWTPDEAQRFVDSFLNGFPQLHAWLLDTAASGVRDQRVETIFGRARRFHPIRMREDVAMIQRQSYNMPIQSVASDICLSAFSRLAFALDPDDGVVLYPIHDSIMLEVAEGREHAVAEVVIREMRDNMPREVRRLNDGLGIPFDVDLKVGLTWADDDMHDLE